MTRQEYDEKREKIQKEREAILKMLNDLRDGTKTIDEHFHFGTAFDEVRTGLADHILTLVKSKIALIRSHGDPDDLYQYDRDGQP